MTTMYASNPYGVAPLDNWLTYRFKQATADAQRHLFECPACTATWHDIAATSCCAACGQEPVHSYATMTDITPDKGF